MTVKPFPGTDGPAAAAGPPPDLAAAPPRQRSLSVRAYLLLLALAVLMPLLVLAGLLTWRAAEAERTRTEQAVAAIGGGVLTVVNREVLGIVETLQTLATSPSLTAGDIRAFQQQIVELGRIVGVGIALRTPDGRLLASSLMPLGEDAAGEPEPSRLDAIVLAERRVVVSGLYMGQGAGQPVFAVMMPVERAGEVRYLLHVSPPATRLRDALASLGVDAAFRLAILDQDGIVLARSFDHEAAVGRRAALQGALAPTVAGGPRIGRGTDHEGRGVFFHAERAQHGWLVVTSVATERIDGPRRRALVNAAIAALLLTGAALLSARLLGTRLAAAIRGLTAAGPSLDRGGAVSIAPSGIREIDEVAATLRLAGERLRAAAAQRAEATERQRLILHELNHRVKNTLAMVQALATLAARGAADVAAYRDRLTERLHGLARTQALLTESDWSGARLEELLRLELGVYEEDAPGRAGATAVHPAPPGLAAAPEPGRIRLSGPAVQLPAHHVVAFGMLVHELATNAAKYGSLSVPQGRLSVTWRIAEQGSDPPDLELAWEESGGPPVVPPSHQGFGTQMIGRGLARQLGATVGTEWRREGVRFSLRMALRPALAGAEGDGLPAVPAAGRG